jgi:hypothetical protein
MQSQASRIWQITKAQYVIRKSASPDPGCEAKLSVNKGLCSGSAGHMRWDKGTTIIPTIFPLHRPQEFSESCLVQLGKVISKDGEG